MVPQASRWLRVAAIALVATGTLMVGQQIYVRIKAEVASVLIRRAYADHLEDGAAHTPWGWADTYPIARLDVERLGITRYVLSGASGGSMAFGPGHIDGTAHPNAMGNCVLAGHRDSWFAFLQHLEPGDELRLETHGRTARYLVRECAIVPMIDESPLEMTDESRLTLVTCWPFNNIMPSRWRYIVVCEREEIRRLALSH